VPLATHRLYCLADDRKLAFFTLWSSTLSALCLTVDAPCVAILFDMAHAFLKWVTTLCAEEVTEVPVLTKRNHMLAED